VVTVDVVRDAEEVRSGRTVEVIPGAVVAE
jgi:hypothetical protein